jgi:hypothetical protein
MPQDKIPTSCPHRFPATRSRKEREEGREYEKSLYVSIIFQAICQ